MKRGGGFIIYSGEKSKLMMRDNSATNSVYYERYGIKPFDVVELVTYPTSWDRDGKGICRKITDADNHGMFFAEVTNNEAIKITPIVGLKERIDRMEMVRCGIVNEPNDFDDTPDWAIGTGYRAGYRLTLDAQCDRDTFEDKYGDRGCQCFSHPPCSHCTHFGNPLNQEEDDSCWEPR